MEACTKFISCKILWNRSEYSAMPCIIYIKIPLDNPCPPSQYIKGASTEQVWQWRLMEAKCIFIEIVYLKKKAIFLTFCPNHFDIYNKALTEDDKKYWESTSENSPQNSSSASP